MAKSCPPAQKPRDTSAPPPLPSRYRHVTLLAEGGMASVYQAEDTDSGQTVAIKTLRTRGAAGLKELQKEVRLLADLRHENIVRLFDAGLCGREVFYAMELIHGVTLRTFLSRSPPAAVEIEWLLGICVKVLEALEYIHGRGWIHGDVKPSNVMVELPSDASADAATALKTADPTVKLLDLGLALDRESALGVTPPAAGTPLYMPPERIVAAAGLDGRCDVYSLGVLLYHLVTRQAPFTTLKAVRDQEPRPAPAHEHNPACSSAVSALVTRFMEREPHNRPSCAAEAREEILSVLKPSRHRATTAARLLPHSFVGRSDELEELRKALRRAADGRGSCVRIAGEAGSGKTWLLEQSGIRSEAAVDLSMAQVRGRFLPGRAVYHGLKEIFQDLLLLIEQEAGAAGLAEALRPWGATLLGILSLEPPIPAEGAGTAPNAGQDTGQNTGQDAPPQPPHVLHERLTQSALRVLRSASALRPVFLTVENLHHADEAEIRLLARLARSLDQLPVVLAVTYRVEAATGTRPAARWLAELDALGTSPRIVLGSLTDHDIDQLLERMLRPPGPVGRSVAATLAGPSQGRPLPLVRAIQCLWERGQFRQKEGNWILQETTCPVPQSDVQWANRVRSLPPLEASVLTGAVVLAEPFDEDLMARLLASAQVPGGGDRSLRHVLRSLARRGLLVEDADGFSAPPDVPQAAVLSAACDKSGKRLHLAAAKALCLHYETTVESHAFNIAEHFHRSGERRKALEYFLIAARYATRVYANRRGVEAYHRALETTRDSKARRTILEELGELHTRLGEYPVALESFRMSSSLRSGARGAQGAAPEEPELLDKIGRVLHRQGNLGEALDFFSRSLRQAGERAEARARALFRIGGVHLDRGDAATAMRHLEESLDIYRQLGDLRHMAAVQSSLGIAEKSQDRLERAIAHFESALESAEKSGRLLDAALILNNLGNTHRARGDDGEAIRCLLRSTEVRKRVGDRQGLAICLNNIARVHAFRGDLSQSRGTTEEALNIFEEIGDRKGVLIATSNLGEIAQLRGNFARARELFSSGLELAEAMKAQRLFAANLCNLAGLELDLAGYAESSELARRCLRSMPDGKAVELRAQALGVLSASALEQDRFQEAEDALRQAVEIVSGLKSHEKLALLVSQQVRLSLARGDPEAAAAVGKEFLLNAAGASDAYGTARLHRELGRAYRELGPDWADLTEKHLGTALRAFESMGSPHNAAFTRVDLAVYWKLLGEVDEAETLFQHAAEELERTGLARRLEELNTLRESS